MNTLKLSKSELKVLKFLTNGRSTDTARQTLQGIHANGCLEATNGWQIHAVKREAIPQIEDGTWGYNKPGEYIEVEPIDGNFPKTADIVSPLADRKPVLTIAVNPQLLKAAIEHNTGAIIMKFYGDAAPMEITGMIECKGSDDVETYAMIMPLHMGDTNREKWTPRGYEPICKPVTEPAQSIEPPAEVEPVEKASEPAEPAHSEPAIESEPEPTSDELAEVVAQLPEPHPAPALEEYEVEYDRNWTWLRFAEKPAAEVRAALKQQGACWSNRRTAWYFTTRVEPAALRAIIA